MHPGSARPRRASEQRVRVRESRRVGELLPAWAPSPLGRLRTWLFLTEAMVASTLTRVVHSQDDPNLSHRSCMARAASPAASSSRRAKPARALGGRNAGLTLVETAA